MNEIQDREMGPEDYDFLLQLDQVNQATPLRRAVSFSPVVTSISINSSSPPSHISRSASEPTTRVKRRNNNSNRPRNHQITDQNIVNSPTQLSLSVNGTTVTTNSPQPKPISVSPLMNRMFHRRATESHLPSINVRRNLENFHIGNNRTTSNNPAVARQPQRPLFHRRDSSPVTTTTLQDNNLNNFVAFGVGIR